MRKRTLGVVAGVGIAVMLGSFTVASALPHRPAPASNCRYSLTGTGDVYTVTAAGSSAVLEEFAPDDTAPVRTVTLAEQTLRIQFLRGMPVADALKDAEDAAQEWARLAEESLRTDGDGATTVTEVLQPGPDLGPLKAFSATIDDGTGDAEYFNLPGGGYVMDEASHIGAGCLRAPAGSTVRSGDVDDRDLYEPAVP